MYVCGRLGHLNGTELQGGASRIRKVLYKKAKFEGDKESADRIIEGMLSDRVFDRLIDDLEPYMVAGTPLICAVPHPPFDDAAGDGYKAATTGRMTNMLPLQYMARLAVNLDAAVDGEIVQKGRVSRTKLKNFPRFLCQPSFDGAVRQDAAYILADDVLTHGGTLAALRSHIIRGGGTVAAVTTLAHGTGRWRELALTTSTWQELCGAFGPGFNSFWRKEIGHDAECLTEAEARVLLRWRADSGGSWDAPLQRLRDRLAEAAAKNE